MHEERGLHKVVEAEGLQTSVRAADHLITGKRFNWWQFLLLGEEEAAEGETNTPLSRAVTNSSDNPVSGASVGPKAPRD